MAEIIGVAASATQLGIACFSLIDIMRKIKGGASTLERYHEQLQELQSLSTCISQNPLLQTAEIGTQTDALLSIINNNCINSLLRKGRVLRTWGFLYREQDLLDIFVRLERQKSNLSLAIEQIQSQALYQIQTDIQNMAEKNTDNMNEKKPSDYRRASRTLVHGASSGYTASSNTHYDLSELNNLVRSLVPPEFQTRFPTDCSSHDNEQGSSNNSNNRTSQADPTYDATSGPSTGNTYNYPVADPGFHQVNGDTNDLNDPLFSELAQNTSHGEKRTPNIYNNPIKIGFGNQYNGHLGDSYGHATGVTGFRMSGGIWNNPRCIAWPSTGPGQMYGRQYNGNARRNQTACASSDQK
ncbi:uncharacterized protein FTOL_12499 [Fusarium torulosum]|uniref:Fungal N-terminal domain-containing protein n=1 Tax=Fusarium torulosum TaxID=33205 RepID=A0AAE8MLZ6_9HYPO|nr:uncharacterized protein FTOL_12499 [Fusarium torulosum]